MQDVEWKNVPVDLWGQDRQHSLLILNHTEHMYADIIFHNHIF